MVTKVKLPGLVMIKLKDKFKIRHIMKNKPLLFHIMLKQGITWFILAFNTQETVSDNIDTFPDDLCSNDMVQFPLGVLLMPVARRHH